MVSDFIFHLRDNEAYLRDAKPPIETIRIEMCSAYLFIFMQIELIFTCKLLHEDSFEDETALPELWD